MKFMIILLLSLSNIFALEEILIVGNEYKPPKVYIDKDTNKPKGILVDMMKYVGDEINVKFKIELYPWKRAVLMAEQGMAGIIGFSKSPERLEKFNYSDSMFFDEMILVVKKGNKFNYNSINDLQGKILGARSGGKYGKDYENGINKIFTLDDDLKSNIRFHKLLANRIDVALIGPGKAGLNAVLNDDLILKNKKEEFEVLDNPFKRDPNFLGFSKKLDKTDFFEKFNMAIKKGYETGTFDKIIKSYE